MSNESQQNPVIHETDLIFKLCTQCTKKTKMQRKTQNTASKYYMYNGELVKEQSWIFFFIFNISRNDEMKRDKVMNVRTINLLSFSSLHTQFE